MNIAYSASRGQFLPIDPALRTTDLNQYLSSDYGGKVYTTVIIRMSILITIAFFVTRSLFPRVWLASMTMIS